jgi:homoserine kinase
MKSGIKVVAPASVSNLACGFDILGMALDVPCDEIIGRWAETPGVHLISITGQKRGIPADPEKNIATVAAKALLHHLGESRRGIELKMHKYIPAGSGIGSSASSAVAAVMLINEMLNRPLEKRELIPFALTGERIASGMTVGDNVIASMMGGLILIRDIESIDFHRIYPPPGLFAAILLPDITIETKTSRGVLRPEVPLHDAIRQAAHLGSFVIGMHNADLDLIRRSLQDFIIEPQRKHLVPHFERVKEVALGLGALGCSISGAGPAIFALCQEKGMAETIALGMQRLYAEHRLDARTFVSAINHHGVTLF